MPGAPPSPLARSELEHCLPALCLLLCCSCPAPWRQRESYTWTARLLLLLGAIIVVCTGLIFWVRKPYTQLITTCNNNPALLGSKLEDTGDTCTPNRI